VCFLANVGQDEPWDEVEKKALKIGALKMVCLFLCPYARSQSRRLTAGCFRLSSTSAANSLKNYASAPSSATPATRADICSARVLLVPSLRVRRSRSPRTRAAGGSVTVAQARATTRCGSSWHCEYTLAQAASRHESSTDM
jgi:hypothetical protein